MSSIVIFDVDGVIIKEQTQLLLTKYLFKKRKLNFFLFINVLFWFFLYKLGLIKDVFKIRKKIFTRFKGWNALEIEHLIEKFFKEELERKINSYIANLLNEHKKTGDEVILVSASLKEIVERLKEYFKLNYTISTELERNAGEYTGNIKGLIPYGRNKIIKILEFLNEKGYTLENSWAYSDHISDRELLELVDNPCVVNPDRELKKLAKKKGWRIYEFR